MDIYCGSTGFVTIPAQQIKSLVAFQALSHAISHVARMTYFPESPSFSKITDEYLDGYKTVPPTITSRELSADRCHADGPRTAEKNVAATDCG
ncbi:hypothetical protein N7539_004847 [Penicillium diatomitis]|uniref:Uncharacterized protein n=1 Tax=Penicillium diatomitis TaxID=2819901 RepID=A0A9X0BU69_9EURO|nr:uncharacterized protein N7539_004847 [Penicillium diatomitis]KAJ5484859.1 hypothetical protein N7539_004847 [Penicillium diatomitis]